MKIHRYSRYWNIRLNLARGYFYKVSRFRRSKFNLEKKKRKEKCKILRDNPRTKDFSIDLSSSRRLINSIFTLDEIRGNVVRGNE